jgi:hypothetical protein
MLSLQHPIFDAAAGHAVVAGVAENLLTSQLGDHTCPVFDSLFADLSAAEHEVSPVECSAPATDATGNAEAVVKRELQKEAASRRLVSAVLGLGLLPYSHPHLVALRTQHQTLLVHLLELLRSIPLTQQDWDACFATLLSCTDPETVILTPNPRHVSPSDLPAAEHP